MPRSESKWLQALRGHIIEGGFHSAAAAALMFFSFSAAPLSAQTLTQEDQELERALYDATDGEGPKDEDATSGSSLQPTTSADSTGSPPENEPTRLPSTAKLPLGQLLIVGFKGTTLNSGLGEVIRETKPGAILLFGRNVRSAQQVARLNHEAQDLSMRVSRSPLLIAIDQEGGNVIRIRHTPTLPSALAIALTKDVGVAKKSGIATGRLLKTLGINVNLAPVVDVSNPETDAFLGTRTFGDDPNRVSTMTTAVANGLQDMGVLPVAKHFPGHGDASGDSHLVAATNQSTFERLSGRDLVPYYALAKSLRRPWGAMLAHVSFPKIDWTSVPATFSKPIVDGIFRQLISRQALVMTDDIEMAGAAAEKDVGIRAVRAIEAGADMVMIAWSRKIQREVLTSLEEALRSGRLKRSRVEEALGRIAAVKRAYIPQQLRLSTNEELKSNLLHRDFVDLGNAVLRAAVRNRRERRPAGTEEFERIRQSSDPVMVLSSRLDFLNSFRKRAVGHKVKSYHLKPSLRSEVARALRTHPESPIVAYVSGRQVASFIASLDEQIASRMVVVNVETGASIGKRSRYRDVFDVHFRHPDVGAAAAEVYLDLGKANAANVTVHRERTSQDQ
ncbi:MAG: glycoside hydrolase family 3 protein [Deltaproteobacteria bacterium]|nr:glycoside hydrolase family 3 protein [Deltaproteobacteria bacterium]